MWSIRNVDTVTVQAPKPTSLDVTWLENFMFVFMFNVFDADFEMNHEFHGIFFHACSCPHEALTEKMTWLGHSFADDPFDDPFGKLLKDKGSPNF